MIGTSPAIGRRAWRFIRNWNSSRKLTPGAPGEHARAVRLAAPPTQRIAMAVTPAPSDTLSSAQSLGGAQVNEVVVTGAKRVALPAGYEPGVLVQSGPGLPDWEFRAYDYSWSGPVEEGATVQFIISPPWLTGLWRIAGLALRCCCCGCWPVERCRRCLGCCRASRHRPRCCSCSRWPGCAAPSLRHGLRQPRTPTSSKTCARGCSRIPDARRTVPRSCPRRSVQARACRSYWT